MSLRSEIQTLKSFIISDNVMGSWYLGESQILPRKNNYSVYLCMPGGKDNIIECW